MNETHDVENQRYESDRADQDTARQAQSFSAVQGPSPDAPLQLKQARHPMTDSGFLEHE